MEGALEAAAAAAAALLFSEELTYTKVKKCNRYTI